MIRSAKIVKRTKSRRGKSKLQLVDGVIITDDYYEKSRNKDEQDS